MVDLKVKKPRGLSAMSIDFTKVDKDLKVVDIFGDQKIPVCETTKKLWAFIKSNSLLLKANTIA